MQNLGPASRAQLKAIGIDTLEQLRACDPYVVYAKLKQHNAKVSLNFLYAIIGAQEGRHWLEIKKERRLEIVLRLEELTLSSVQAHL